MVPTNFMSVYTVYSWYVIKVIFVSFWLLQIVGKSREVGVKIKRFEFLFITGFFVVVCLLIISKWAPLFAGMLWVLWIELKVLGQLIGIKSVEVTPHRS